MSKHNYTHQVSAITPLQVYKIHPARQTRIMPVHQQAPPVRASPEHEDRDFAYAGYLFNTVMFPMILQEAVHMDLFQIIAKYDQAGFGLTAEDIATKLNTSNPHAPAMLDRMLYMLTCHEVLKCSVSDGIRFYSLAPVAKCFVRNEAGKFLGSRLATQKLFIEGWYVYI